MEILKLYETVITSANIIRVAAGTTGLMGGDGGHGGRTIIELEDLAGTAMEIRLIREEPGMIPKGVVIELAGDSELETFIDGLEFIIAKLKKGRDQHGR